MENIYQYEEYFLSGKFDKCEGSILQLLRSSSNFRTPESSSYRSKFVPVGLDSETWDCTLEINIIVSKGLRLVCAHSKANEDWIDVAKALANCYTKIDVLQYLGESCLELYLSVVYNNLWWGWMNRSPDINPDGNTWENLLHVSNRCFKQVLETCQDPALGSSVIRGVELCLNLMKKTLLHFLHLEVIHSIQLIEIYMLTIQIILELEKISSVREQCVDFIINLCDVLIRFETKLKLYEQIKSSHAIKKPKIFKFGFHSLNSTTSNYNPQLLFEVVCFMSSLCCMRLGYHKKSLLFFHNIQNRCKNVQLLFLWNYLQAYSYYKLNELDACMLYITELSRLMLSGNSEGCYHLLHGQLLLGMRDYRASHVELQKVFQNQQYQLTAVYYILLNIKQALLPYDRNTDTKDQSESTASVYDNIYHKYIRALTCLYEFVELYVEPDLCDTVDFENKIINKVHEKSKISLSDVLYFIGKELFKHLPGSFEDPDIQLVKVISDCYISTLEATRMSRPLKASEDPKYFLMLPPIRIVYHEAVVAFLLGGQLDTAETVCAVPLLYPLDQGADDWQGTERVLFSLDEDIVALMLLALIKKQNGQHLEEAELLNRCKKSILKYFFGKKLNEATVQLVDKESRLMDMFAARIYLLKALLHHKNSYKIDAIENLERALHHNPDDLLIRHHYDMISDTSIDMDAYQGRPSNRVAVEDTNIAVQYLLSAYL